MESQRILVTGGAGFIGTNLVHELESRGNEVYSIDLYNNERENYSRVDVKNSGRVTTCTIDKWDE